jgi:hypothetical protein
MLRLGRKIANLGIGYNVAGALLFAVLGPGTPPALAQLRVFPAVEAFEYPLGGHRSSGVTGRLLSVRRPESDFGVEREADVSIGENVPLLGFGDRTAHLGLTIRVLGRFSLDDPKSALISNDWVVGLHAVADRGPWRLVLEGYHESSHLGDEYAERFDVRRLDWTREVVSLWVRREVGALSFHLTGSVTAIDELALPRGAFGLGLDYRGGGGSIRPVLGVFTESVGYAGWKATTTGRAGVELGGPGGRMAVGLVFLNGLSPQRQFYDRLGRYYGFELRFDF